MEKGRLTPEHPGTAVRWEEEVFEVLDVDAAEGGGVRYTLALWHEQHAIRVVESYDEASETRRQHERETHARRERHRGGFLLLTPLLGLLPASVQQEIENEHAIPATRLTLLSAIPLLLFGIFCWISLRALGFGAPPLLPVPVLALGQFFWFESLVRIGACMMQARPVGSLIGHAVWGVWRRLSPGRVPANRPVPASVPSGRAAQDSFLLLEPFLSLLDASDQAKLKELFDFDGVRWGKVTAFIILVAVGPMFLAAFLGTLIVPEPSDFLLMALTGTLVIEQVLRLRKLARGRVAPSLLRFLVRPLARRLLDAGGE